MALIFTKEQGAVLQAGDGGSPTETFTAIAGVLSINLGAISRTVIDTTDLDSANNARTFAGGLVDYGEFSADIHFDPNAATHDEATGIYSYFGDAAPRNFRFIFPNADTTTFAFSAITSSLTITGSLDEKMTGTVTFKISGEPTLS